MSQHQVHEEVYETPEIEDHAPIPSRAERKPASVDNATVLHNQVHPAKAFEVFMGKHYTGDDLSDNVGGSKWGSSAMYAVEGLKDGIKVLEGPRERLARLRGEVVQLADDLAEMTEPKSDKNDEDGPTSTSRPEDLWTAMSSEVKELQHELLSIASDASFQPVLDPTAQSGGKIGALQSELAAQVLEQVTALKKAAASANSTAAPGGGAPVTYELFLKGQSQGLDQNLGKLGGLEARIATLEGALGRVEGGEKASLVAKVASLEERVARMDPKALEALQKKAQLAKIELEALARAHRTKDSSRAAASAKTIEKMYESSQKCEGLVDELPTLVERLVTLQGIHQEAASFRDRLAGMEAGQARVEKLLGTTQQTLEEVTQSLASNIETVQANIASVDDRIAALSPTGQGS
ncbi:unnamed protein product [Chrysoparadoxa australica]